jgi:hypothetical protein
MTTPIDPSPLYSKSQSERLIPLLLFAPDCATTAIIAFLALLLSRITGLKLLLEHGHAKVEAILVNHVVPGLTDNLLFTLLPRRVGLQWVDSGDPIPPLSGILCGWYGAECHVSTRLITICSN